MIGLLSPNLASLIFNSLGVIQIKSLQDFLVERRKRSARNTKTHFQKACIFHYKTVNILLKVKNIFVFQQTLNINLVYGY